MRKKLRACYVIKRAILRWKARKEHIRKIREKNKNIFAEQDEVQRQTAARTILRYYRKYAREKKLRGTVDKRKRLPTEQESPVKKEQEEKKVA